MGIEIKPLKIAIIGGGPSGMFAFKRLLESGKRNFEIDVFESSKRVGCGMPYGNEGSNLEHITNVSDNEIPEIVTHIKEWVSTVPNDLLEKFNIDREKFTEYKVLPRLFFGEYLSAQFEMLLERAKELGITHRIHTGCNVIDVISDSDAKVVSVLIADKRLFNFDKIIISTGHSFPKVNEGKVDGYYDSPYPPSKLGLKLNHPVALKGSSLTAIDAIRTLARENGKFEIEKDNSLRYQASEDSIDFKIVMHSRNGLLPGIRFHLDDSHLSNAKLLTAKEIALHISQNDGFLSLDYIFEKDFKDLFREKKPEFYERIRNYTMEEFVDAMMEMREIIEPFHLFRAEYKEAEKSIKRRESVYWKEFLAVLSFAMNYPAKHFSAEDMQRLQKKLKPLISIVIAFVPQSSAEELIALHNAGRLEIIAVGDESKIEIVNDKEIVYIYDENNHTERTTFKTFIDCVGQPHLSYNDFPFKSLLNNKNISSARIKFKSAEKGKEEFSKGKGNVVQDSSGDFYLTVSGIAINDNFQIIDQFGAYNEQIYMMAVPYISGYNPDYSGLDFCSEASNRIVTSIFSCVPQNVLAG
ncbi:MAG: FAD/NAD(P)-binding protein [Bacteroidia bacterium]